MTDDKKEDVMDGKQAMVKSGKIEDPRVYKLLYLDQIIEKERLRIELKKRTVHEQIEALKADRQAVVRRSEHQIDNCSNQLTAIREAFAEDYKIDLDLWGYDDITGVAVLLPPDVQAQILARKAQQKKLEDERAAEKRDAALKAEAEADKAEKALRLVEDEEDANAETEKAVDNRKRSRKKRKADASATDGALESQEGPPTDTVEA